MSRCNIGHEIWHGTTTAYVETETAFPFSVDAETAFP